MENSIYGKHRPEMERVMNELVEYITQVRLKLKNETGIDPIEHCLFRIKSEESMREKCRRKGIPETPHSALRVCQDAIGVRIVTAFQEDIRVIADRIRSSGQVEVVEEKDYIRHAKPNGYRSYHMILMATADHPDPEGNVPGRFFVELQLRTIAMDSWASLEHKMSYKRDIPDRELIREELKRCADELAACDISMQTIRDMILGRPFSE